MIKQNIAKREILGVGGYVKFRPPPPFAGVSMGLSSCVVLKKSIFRKNCAIPPLPYARDAYACKWSRSCAEKLKIFSTRSEWRPNLKIQPGITSSVLKFKDLDSYNEKVTIEGRRGKLQ